MSPFLQRALTAVAPQRFLRDAPESSEETMEAVVYESHGAPDAVMQVARRPRPVPLGRQVLIRVAGGAINPLDIKLCDNALPLAVRPLPKIPCSDVSGVVEMAPPESEFEAGDRVFAMMPALGTRWGSCAEYVAPHEKLLVRAPVNVPLEEAATLPLVGCSVLQGMAPVVRAMRGQTQGKRVLIQAGCGGVGSFAVQYCKHVLGMEVAATCSGDDGRAMLHELGADHAIDYKKQQFDEVARDYDVVVDPLAYIYEERTLRGSVLKRKGSHYVNIAGSAWRVDRSRGDSWKLAIPEATLPQVVGGQLKRGWSRVKSLGGAGAHYHHVFVHADRTCLEEIRRFVERGQIKPRIAKRYALSATAQAHMDLSAGHTRGKLLVVVNPEAPGQG